MAQIIIPEGAAPSTPSAGNVALYAKSDGLMYSKDDAGVETVLSSAGLNTFTTFAVSGQSDVVAESPSDTLTLVAGSNVTITTNATTDSITISASTGGVADGDKGDITVTASGATWTIDANAVTTTKINDAAVTTAKINDTAVTNAKLNSDVFSTARSWSASQRGTVTTDNDLSFDLNVTNNFSCTPSAGGTLTFTNITAGQSGFIKLVNGSNYTISAHANTKVTSSFLTTISATGTYVISYWSDGTNVYCATAGAMA